MRYNMALQVLSSFEDKPGTLIVGDDMIEELKMERQLVTGIAHDKNEARVTLIGLPDKAGTVAAIFAPLAAANINVDMIVQSGAGTGGPSDLTFTVPTASLAHAVAALEKAKSAIGFDKIITDTDVVKVSAVGIGMRSNAGIAAQMFETLAERGINILAISTSEIKVSVLVPEDYTELAVRVLHTAFGLDAQETAGAAA
jgi:aspartate kinase